MEFIIKKEAEFKDLEDSWPRRIVKKFFLMFRRKYQGMAKQCLISLLWIERSQMLCIRP
jgi:hypothetical protein